MGSQSAELSLSYQQSQGDGRESVARLWSHVYFGVTHFQEIRRSLILRKKDRYENTLG